MHRAHWLVGTLTLGIFIFTGAYMRYIHEPPVEELDETTRIFYRSRHLYLMLGALANLAMASAAVQSRRERVIGWLVILAPAFLIAAFFIEPERGLAKVQLAPLGLYALFGAAALLVLRGARKY